MDYTNLLHPVIKKSAINSINRKQSQNFDQQVPTTMRFYQPTFNKPKWIHAASHHRNCATRKWSTPKAIVNRQQSKDQNQWLETTANQTTNSNKTSHKIKVHFRLHTAQFSPHTEFCPNAIKSSILIGEHWSQWRPWTRVWFSYHRIGTNQHP